MEITTSVIQGSVPVNVVRLAGDLDANSSEEFKVKIDNLIAQGAKDILVDLAEVPFMSSAGIRALHSLYTLLHGDSSEQSKQSVYQDIAAGTYSAPHLKLINANKKVSDVIKISGLDMYIKTYNSEQEAIAAF